MNHEIAVEVENAPSEVIAVPVLVTLGKQESEGQTVQVPHVAAQPIERDRWYTASEVAGILNISYDSAKRRLPGMPGCVDFGTKPDVRNRTSGRKLLRVPGKGLIEYLRRHRVM